MANNSQLYKSFREINQNNLDPIPDPEHYPICPRLIDLFADWIYKGGYKAYEVQTASISFRKMLYKSFLSQLTPQERQLDIFDEIQNTEFI